MNRIDEIRLNIYESYEDGDISEYEKDLLLEKCNIVEESTALQRHMKDKDMSYYGSLRDKIPEKSLKYYHKHAKTIKDKMSSDGDRIKSYNDIIKDREENFKKTRGVDKSVFHYKNMKEQIQNRAMDYAKDSSASSKKRGNELAKEIAKEKKIRQNQEGSASDKKRNDKKDKELALKMTRGIEDKQITKSALDAIDPKKKRKSILKNNM